MKTITLAASKGGVGKSTLCFSLAVMAGREGAAGVMDWEPQGSVSMWWTMRGRPDNPMLMQGEDPVKVAKRAARDLDWLFIDTTPSGISEIERAIIPADVVLIPTHVSLLDIAAVRPVADICRELGKNYAFVLNEVPGNQAKLITSSIEVLSRFGPVLDEQISNRMGYVTSMQTKGRTGPEHPDAKQARECKAEIANLWAAVKKLAGAKP